MKKIFLFVLGLVVLQASLLEASKNAGTTSNRSNNRNGGRSNGGSQNGGGGWGNSGHSSYRGRREIDDEEPEEIREKRSFAPGAPSVPSTQQGSNQQSGSWGVSVNKDKGTGPQIRTDAQGNIYKNGNVRVDGQGHHEFGKGRKPSFGGSIRGRWRRETEDEPEEIREKRSFAPGAPSFPSPQQGSSQQSGSWGVSVNKDKGTGPQVRTDAQGNIYKNGNVRVDGQGHHEFGKGRKPSFGGSIRGRWRRETEDEPQVREKRQFNFMPYPQPQQPRFPQPLPGNRGSIGVTVNRDQGRGPQIRTEAEGRIFTSKDGNWRVDGNGFHEAGKGRKPDYGVGVKVEGRFRREIETDDTQDVRNPSDLPLATIPLPPKLTIPQVQPIPPQDVPIYYVQPIHPFYLPQIPENFLDNTVAFSEEHAQVAEETREKRSPQEKGSVSVSVNKDQGRGPQVRTDAQGNIHTSRDGNWRVDAHGTHEFGHGRKPSYGGGISVTGRFRRDAEEEESVDEQIDDLEVTSRDKRSIRVPRPPVSRPIRPIPIKPIRPIRPVQPHRRERRDADEDNFDETVAVEEEEVAVETREKRSPQDNGQVSVSVNKDQGRGPQVRTDAQGNIYTSRDGNWRVDAHGNHEFGHGRKPSYGGGISVTGRFRRDAEEEESEDVQIEEEVAEREKRSPDGPKIIKTVYIRPLKPKKPVIRKVRDIDSEDLIQENEEQIEENMEEPETREKRSIGRPPRPDVLINRPILRPYPRPFPRPIRPYPRFRREAEDELTDEEEITETRQKRSPQKKGQVNVSVNKDQGRGPQVRTDAQYQIYKKNNWEVNSHANHEFGRGRKPSYGGGISVSKRF